MIKLIDIDNVEERKKLRVSFENINSFVPSLWPEFLKAVKDTYNILGFYIICFNENELTGIASFYKKPAVIGKRTLVSVPGGFWAKNELYEIELIEALNKISLDQGLNGPVYRDLNISLTTINTKNTAFEAVKFLPEDEEELLSSYSKNIRRDIRHSKRYNLNVDDSNDVKSFYTVWANNMRDLGTPPVHSRFFYYIKKYFKENTKILLVRKEDQVIGGVFIHYYKDCATGLYFSNLKKYSKCFPNIFLYNEMLKWSCRNGIKIFNMGRSQPGSGNEKFKLRFKAKLIPLYSYPYYSHQGTMKSILTNTWKYVPFKLSNLTGPIIRRYIPFG